MIVPTAERYFGDWRVYAHDLPDNYFQAVITDPPYDGCAMDMDELMRVCSGNIIMFCAPELRFFKPDEMAYWIKTPSTKNFCQHLGRFVELILIRRRGGVFNSGLHWSNYTGVYDDRLLTKQAHPFEKPLALMERLIAIYTEPGSLIFDPFMGSGTTLRAARKLGRQSVGCETNYDYFKLSEDLE